MFKRLIQTPIVVGALAAILVLFWQFLTVRFNYEGRWSALFYMGNHWALPSSLASENPYLFRNNPGYDGMFYHLIAHDPVFKKGYQQYVDNSSLRWRRILVPGLAHILALGKDRWVDASYIVVNLLLVFAGAYWLSRFSVMHGFRPALGLLFVATPSVLVSLDRLTIDTALAALTIAFILYSSDRSLPKRYAVLSLCPLARETGVCLALGQIAEHVREREWKGIALTAASVVPFALWAGFVRWSAPLDATPWLSFPFVGIVRRTLTPVIYPITGRWVATAAVMDYLALVGIWVALILALVLVLKRSWGLLEFSIVAFAFFAVWLGKADIWAGAYEFGRTMSPLLILLGLLAIRSKNFRYLLPLGLVLPRIALQFEPQLRGILKGLLQ